MADYPCPLVRTTAHPGGGYQVEERIVADAAAEAAALAEGFQVVAALPPPPFVEYPKWLYHATDGAVVVLSEEEAAALGPGWQETPIAPAAVAPVLTALEPDTVTLGAPSFTIHVLGTDFAPDAVILWNGTAEATTYVSATELTTGVNMATATVATAVSVAVAQAGVESNALPFTFTEAEE